jgi:hypothetical protein
MILHNKLIALLIKLINLIKAFDIKKNLFLISKRIKLIPLLSCLQLN